MDPELSILIMGNILAKLEKGFLSSTVLRKKDYILRFCLLLRLAHNVILRLRFITFSWCSFFSHYLNKMKITLIISVWWLFYCEGILSTLSSLSNIKINFLSKSNRLKSLHFQIHCPNLSFDMVENWIPRSKENKVMSKGTISKYCNSNGFSKLQNRYCTVKHSIHSSFWIPTEK